MRSFANCDTVWNAGIQLFQVVMDSGYRIESGTGFAGVTGIETFYETVNFGLKRFYRRITFII
jgi:hypothetical protein